jgi:hypothetical protein
MPDPTARPSLSPEPPSSAWLLGPDTFAAIHADHRLRDRLAAGERPDEHDPDPVAAVLALWLHEIKDGGAQ